MPRYLLTPSLYDSWRFYQLMESKEKQEFLDSLLKKPITDPDSLKNMAAGRQFEDDVRHLCERPKSVVSSEAMVRDQNRLRCVMEVANIVRGGLWQERVMFELNFGGIRFLVYGKLDVVKRDWIYDIKRSKTYEIGKYTQSVQHTTYMVGTGIKNFAYLISDEEDVFREEYRLTTEMHETMISEYGGLVEGIMSDADFKAAYFEKWEADKPRAVA